MKIVVVMALVAAAISGGVGILLVRGPRGGSTRTASDFANALRMRVGVAVDCKACPEWPKPSRRVVGRKQEVGIERTLAVVATVAAAMVACSGSRATPTALVSSTTPRNTATIDEVRRFSDYAVYSAGTTVEGLPLTHVQRSGALRARPTVTNDTAHQFANQCVAAPTRRSA